MRDSEVMGKFIKNAIDSDDTQRNSIIFAFFSGGLLIIIGIICAIFLDFEMIAFSLMGLAFIGAGHYVKKTKLEEIVVYEYGIEIFYMHKKETYMYYETAIADYITKHINEFFITTGRTYDIIFYKYKGFEKERIAKKDFSTLKIPQFKNALIAAIEAHTYHWTKNLTKENIHKLNLRFTVSGNLILRNGKLAYRSEYSEERKAFPIEKVEEVTYNKRGNLLLLAPKDEKGKDVILAEIEANDFLNQNILFHIIGLAGGPRKLLQRFDVYGEVEKSKEANIDTEIS